MDLRQTGAKYGFSKQPLKKIKKAIKSSLQTPSGWPPNLKCFLKLFIKNKKLKQIFMIPFLGSEKAYMRSLTTWIACTTEPP